MNMAQGFTTSDGVLSRGGRESVQCAFLAIPDGKYSLKYQKAVKTRELKDKYVQIFLVPVSVFQRKRASEAEAVDKPLMGK